MPSSSELSATQDSIVHFTSLRMRITGSGQLKMTMFSQDDVFSSPLVPFTMKAVTNIRPTRLMNFLHQRACLEGTTTETGEWFSINKIVIYAKEVFTDYPDGGG